MKKPTYLVIGSKPWNRRVFDQRLRRMSGRWEFVSDRGVLTTDFVRSLSPRYVFFLHWSWKVPADLVREFECVCFHMTDVPYGRGGSPLQNLIARGQRETKLTALRMTDKLDAGPVYAKVPLSLEGGTAEEIYIRASELAATVIERIVRQQPRPLQQRGRATTFVRRTPEQSRLPQDMTLSRLHDFVRMLDAAGYPKAFLEHGGLRFEFSRAALYDGRVVADVTITQASEAVRA